MSKHPYGICRTNARSSAENLQNLFQIILMVFVEKSRFTIEVVQNLCQNILMVSVEKMQDLATKNNTKPITATTITTTATAIAAAATATAAAAATATAAATASVAIKAIILVFFLRHHSAPRTG